MVAVFALRLEFLILVNFTLTPDWLLRSRRTEMSNRTPELIGCAGVLARWTVLAAEGESSWQRCPHRWAVAVSHTYETVRDVILQEIELLVSTSIYSPQRKGFRLLIDFFI